MDKSGPMKAWTMDGSFNLPNRKVATRSHIDLGLPSTDSLASTALVLPSQGFPQTKRIFSYSSTLEFSIKEDLLTCVCLAAVKRVSIIRLVSKVPHHWLRIRLSKNMQSYIKNMFVNVILYPSSKFYVNSSIMTSIKIT